MFHLLKTPSPARLQSAKTIRNVKRVILVIALASAICISLGCHSSPQERSPKLGDATGSHSRITESSCPDISFTMAPQSPKTTLPGRAFTFMLGVNNISQSDLSDLVAVYEWDPTLANLMSDTPSRTPGQAYEALETIRPGESLARFPTWTTTDSAAIGTSIPMTVRVASERHFQVWGDRLVTSIPRDGGIDAPNGTDEPEICTLTTTISIRPPEPVYLRAPVISELSVSDRTPTPGNLILVAVSVHNPALYPASAVQLQFDQDSNGNSEWLDFHSGRSRWLFSDESGYKGTYFEVLAHSDAVANGEKVNIPHALPPGDTLTLALEGTVKSGLAEGMEFEPRVCVTTVIDEGRDTEQICSSEKVMISRPASHMEINMWVDSIRTHAGGPYVFNVVLGNNGNSAVQGVRMHVDLPAVLRYAPSSGVAMMVDGDGRWRHLGASGRSVPDGWRNDGLLLSSLPTGWQGHYRFAAYIRSDGAIGQTASIGVRATKDGEEMGVGKRYRITLPALTPLSHVTVEGGAELVPGAFRGDVVESPRLLREGGVKDSELCGRRVVSDGRAMQVLGVHVLEELRKGRGETLLQVIECPDTRSEELDIFGDVLVYRLVATNMSQYDVDHLSVVIMPPNGSVLLNGHVVTGGDPPKVVSLEQIAEANGVSIGDEAMFGRMLRWPDLGAEDAMEIVLRFGVAEVRGPTGVQNHLLNVWLRPGADEEVDPGAIVGWVGVGAVAYVDAGLSKEELEEAIDRVSPFNAAGEAFDWLLLESLGIVLSLGVVTGIGWLIYANRRRYRARTMKVVDVAWQVLTRGFGIGGWGPVVIVVVWCMLLAPRWPMGWSTEWLWLCCAFVVMGVWFILAKWCYRLLDPSERGVPPPDFGEYG